MTVQARHLADDQVVSQYGCRSEIASIKPPFHHRPRIYGKGKSEPGLSVIVGRLTPFQAADAVRSDRVPAADDGVRYTTVGQLRAAGFTVTHTPSARNPAHATVSRNPVWEDDEDERFDSCFDEPIWMEEVTDDE